MKYILIFILSVVAFSTQAQQTWKLHEKYDKYWTYNAITGKGYQMDSSGVTITQDSLRRTIIFKWDLTAKGIDTVNFERVETSKDDDRYDTLGTVHKFLPRQAIVYHTAGWGDIIYLPKSGAVIRNYPYRFRSIFYNKK